MSFRINVRLNRLFLAVAVLLVALLAYLLGWSGMLTIEQIKVSGIKNSKNPADLSTQKVIKVSGIKKGQPIARVNSAAVKRKLLSLPEIADVSINRKLPNFVEINIRMREVEIAVTAPDGGYLLGDSSGVTFAKVNRVPRGVPIIMASASNSLLAQTLLIYNALPSKIQDRVISIDAKTRDSILFNLKVGVRIVWGGVEEVELKIKVLNALMAEPSNKNVKNFDISSPLAPTVR